MTILKDDIYNLLMIELNNLPAYDIFLNSPPTYAIPIYDTQYDALLNTLYTDTYTDTVVNNSFNDDLPYKQIICDDELNKLINTKIKYTKVDNENIKNTTCPITQIEFIEQQEIIELDCNHCFDAEAIIYWLTEEKAECPVCRFNYKVYQKKQTQ